MRVFDAHCDSVCGLFDGRRNLYNNNLQLDLRRMQMYSGYTQVFAAYADPKHKDRMLERVIDLIDYLAREIDKHKDYIKLCRNGNDLRSAQKDGKAAAFLALEGADAVTTPAMLRTFYRLGVRVISPVWNVSNHIATSVTEVSPKEGLSWFGKMIFSEMNNLGMIADVSHASDRTFWDIFDIYTMPVIATHSNARAVAGNNRNLSDIQFNAVQRSGGCVGINLYPYFLTSKSQASIDDILRHIEHFCALGGEDSIGLGCDFDGVDILPEGIAGAEDLWKIFDALSAHGYSDNIIQKIAYKNFERVFSQLK